MEAKYYIKKKYDNFIANLIKAKYKQKCKILDISDSLLNKMSQSPKNSKLIFSILDKSNNKDEFSQKLIQLLMNSYNNDTNQKYILSNYNNMFLIGLFLGKYNYYSSLFASHVNNKNIKNFVATHNNRQIISNLKEHLFDYIYSSNKIKTNFYSKKEITKGNDTITLTDFTGDIDENKIEQIFDDVVSGKNIKSEDSHIAECIVQYIFFVLNRYTIDDILNNFDFIVYDLKSSDNISLNEKRKIFNKNKSLDSEKILKINNINLLKSKLQSINNEDSQKLLNKLNTISDPYNQIDTLEDIYLEYESLFRSDIISHLYVPLEKEILINDYNDLRPQLIMRIANNSYYDYEYNLYKNEIINTIINERNNGNKNEELTEEENERLKKALIALENKLNPVQVNTSVNDSNILKYNIQNFYAHKTDTSNNFTATLYSDKYFLKFRGNIIGVGFNNNGLDPEAISISSINRVDTSNGLNNISYNEKEKFKTTSASYKELIENDGNSEIVIYRKGIDFETKASYIFVAFDTSIDGYKEYINEAKKLADKNNMKLVMYDIKKIKKSYRESINTVNNEKSQHSR